MIWTKRGLHWFSNIVNKSCVVRKASDYPGQSQGSFHQKYNNLMITLFLHCFSCYWLIFSLHFLSQSKQRVFSTSPRVELNTFNFHVGTEESYYSWMNWSWKELSHHTAEALHSHNTSSFYFAAMKICFNQSEALATFNSDTSSVWNLCTSFPEVISRSGGKRWWRHEMLVVIWGKKRYCFTISSPTTLFLTLYQGSTLAWRSTVLNKFTSFDRSSMRNSYFLRQGVLGLNLN